MHTKRLVLIGLTATLLVTGLGAVGVVGAHGNDNPDHPACTGDKYQISSEGANVAGDATGSKWWVKPVCTDDARHVHSHTPDDTLSVPESETMGAQETARAASPNVTD